MVGGRLGYGSVRSPSASATTRSTRSAAASEAATARSMARAAYDGAHRPLAYAHSGCAGQARCASPRMRAARLVCPAMSRGVREAGVWYAPALRPWSPRAVRR